MCERATRARARRLLAALLALYPAGFRREMGEDLVATALYRWREARGRGRRLGTLRFWCTEGVRFAVDGVLERLRALPRPAGEIRQAWRQLRRAPGHHALAIATLALGVGATTTIFTVADAVVFRPLPYPGAEALFLIHSRLGSMELSSNSLPNLRDVQSSVRTLAWLAGAQDRSPALTGDGREAERVSALDVTDEYLPGLGARVQIGRLFIAADHAAEAERVALVSHGLWQRRWGSDDAVLGRTLLLDGVAHTVVGVMSPAFRDPQPVESGAITGVWIPARDDDPRFAHRDDYGFRWIGRLAEGVEIDTARQELSAAGRWLTSTYPDANGVADDDLDFVLHPLHQMTVGEARTRLLMLLGAVALLMLLSCTNVASLFLARGATRGAELAIRSALGATRWRIAAQLFAESLLTAGLAGAAGTLLGALGLRVFLAAVPPETPRLHEVHLDVRALAFVAMLTVVTATLFGTGPALRGARTAGAAGPGGRATASRRARRLQSALVAAEVALSLVLVTGSGLLLNSFLHLARVDPGFDGQDVVVVDLRPPFSSTTAAADRAFHRALLERARAEPGVGHAALAYTVPGPGGGAWTPVTPEGDAPGGAASRQAGAPARGLAPGEDWFAINPVAGDFFAALEIPLRAGRVFADDPGEGEPLVVVLNGAAARRFFPGVERPIGRRLALGPPGSDAPLRDVVGIVGDVRQQGPGHDPEPQIYLPYGQRDVPRLRLLLELRAGTTLPADAIRTLVHDIAPDVPVDGIEPLHARYAAAGAGAQFLAFLLSTFAGIGLLLAAVGTYATTSHAVTSRVREVGIRMALGARAGAVLRMMLARALSVAGAGIAAGLLLALALGRFLEGYVYGITARDPLTVAAACALIGACATLASLAPAVRAARVDPTIAVRSE